MNQTKVQFSNSERELMCNSEVILTKNKVIQKIKTLLEELQNDLTTNCEANSKLLSNEIFSIHPKISKGENYQGLPYLILDYPRVFKQEDIFAIRTMFWWGNFFSTTLHISGLFKLQYAQNIIASFSILTSEGFSVGINTDPWLHHFGADNYRQIASMNEKMFQEECNKQAHLKIAKTISLNESNVSEKISESWKLLTEICFH